MSDELERDPALRAALRVVYDDGPAGDAELERVRASITARAAPLLARRRTRRLRWPVFVPVALAASFALFFALSTTPDSPDDAQVVGQGPLSVDQILEAEMPERQLRALLAGAAQAEELLLIAAAEEQDAEPESNP